ncbi:MAG: hypothetical protein FJ014_15685 [Chloroflexi bacterium]|nr:hypothetical protein [Chloroflexota bacterium]
MSSNETILQRASAWMLARGWKRKIAKRRQFDQSLFEHSLVELDAALQLLPILRQPSHFDLSPEEEQVLVISLVAHDVGKERPEWQEYILGHRGFVSDVEPALTSAVLPDLCSALAFPDLDQKVMAVIENCVNLHMSHERRDTNVILAMLQGTDRWYTLANLVFHIDNICSAKGVFEARSALERSLLGKHLKTACHQVIIRGVSTTALHRAALEGFRETGWTPLLHFSDATLYVCSAAQLVAAPTPAQIEHRLAKVLDESIGRDVAPLVVGNEMQNFLPKPDLFDYREIRVYLVEASKRANPLSFKKKPQEYRHNVVTRYLSLRGDIFEELNESATDLQSERIGSARPEMAVFRFFKNAMGADLIGEDGMSVAEQEYDAIFGQGAWNDLKSMSTYMPASDMAKRVDRFWELPGKQFRLDVVSIEELAPDKRVDLLIDTLTGIANKVYAVIPNPPTRATLAREMAAGFIQDLVSPAEQIDLPELARQQMEFYAASKPFAGKQTKKARYLCPICNTPFEEGTKAAADFVDKPESHTNRGVAHGPFGYITICDTCKHERILRQLLLGERAAELIIIFPRMNIGPGAGEILMHKAQTLYDRAYALMVGDTEDPDRRLWLAFTPFIADQVLDQDLYQLTPEQLADLLAYRPGEENRQKNRRQLEKALREAYEDDLEGVNAEWGTDFISWDEATAAVYINKVADPTARRIRAEIYRLYPQMRLVCQTPHMIMLPVAYPIRQQVETTAGKREPESESNEALRKVFVGLLLGLALDCSAAIVRDSDQIDFQGGEGIAFVPPVGGVRGLVGTNWVPLSEAERWFQRIAAISILTDQARYSKKSGLFEALIEAQLPGRILRRLEAQIEENRRKKRGKQSLTIRDIELLRILEA